MDRVNTTKVDYTEFFKSKDNKNKELLYFEKQLHPKYGEIYVQKCRMK